MSLSSSSSSFISSFFLLLLFLPLSSSSSLSSYCCSFTLSTVTPTTSWFFPTLSRTRAENILKSEVSFLPLYHHSLPYLLPSALPSPPHFQIISLPPSTQLPTFLSSPHLLTSLSSLSRSTQLPISLSSLTFLSSPPYLPTSFFSLLLSSLPYLPSTHTYSVHCTHMHTAHILSLISVSTVFALHQHV